MVYLGRTKVKDMFIDAKPELFKLARGYRKNPTEAKLFRHLSLSVSGGLTTNQSQQAAF